jgi:hypothetical protein
MVVSYKLTAVEQNSRTNLVGRRNGDCVPPQRINSKAILFC